MKKTVAMIALGLISAGCGISQTSVWKISKGSHEIYLGGSVHLLRPGDFPLPKEFDVAFAKASTLVLEADVKDPQILTKVMSEIMLPEGQTLKSVLNEKQYKALYDAATEIGLPFSTIERMKPGMAMITLSSAKMSKIELTAGGVDIYYYDKASSKNKNVEFLESIDFQLDLICNLPFDIDEFTAYTLEDLEKLDYEDEFVQLIDEWRHGKTTSQNEITRMKQQYPSVYKAMFTDRNRKWLPKIKKYLEDDNIEFVLVGAAHLWGDDGLIAMLKKEGYKIGQLRVKN
ncbi:MAG: TraB/GumN family protein [Prevotellaceae bacterium]|jgi:uncharacterized protein YbaP (TraB family)|nr:TraB/GumN family protein [Prevotellaceae bacterium]